jgi:nitroimidazol reductase NimA-like FMN-containing flavoprotein (pyridoxamine 5'-phosphate oxidase superfamily)
MARPGIETIQPQTSNLKRTESRPKMATPTAPSTASPASHGPPSARTKLRRGAQRADYAPDTVAAILDEALMCHVGVSLDDHPAVIPTAFAVVDDQLYVHGSTANRMFRAMRDGAEACVVFTLLDGLVLARSAFHHSVNYRSVILYGRAREVTDLAEKRRAFDALIDHVVPGRSTEVRPANGAELARTLVLALPLDEASAKIRTGPPVDEEDDYALEIWAGVVPLRTHASPPESDPRTALPVPAGVEARYRDLTG